jgi:divalent metal cation (Fe/Co/Zn/Cd) transporter
VQVGQAAVQMMRATLAELVDGKPDQEAQEKAYELLKKVAQGREQSPLISPALDTLRYLQQTVE